MATKRKRFSVVVEYPQTVEIGSGIKFDNTFIIVTSIRKVEYITNRLIQVSGLGTA